MSLQCEPVVCESCRILYPTLTWLSFTQSQCQKGVLTVASTKFIHNTTKNSPNSHPRRQHRTLLCRLTVAPTLSGKNECVCSPHTLCRDHCKSHTVTVMFVTGMFECLRATQGVGGCRMLPGRNPESRCHQHRPQTGQSQVEKGAAYRKRGSLPSGRVLMPGSHRAQVSTLPRGVLCTQPL